MLIKTRVHLGVARLVKLDPFGKKIVMIEFAIVVGEGAPDQLTSVSVSPPLQSQPDDQFHEQSLLYQFFTLGKKPCFILADYDTSWLGTPPANIKYRILAALWLVALTVILAVASRVDEGMRDICQPSPFAEQHEGLARSKQLAILCILFIRTHSSPARV